MKYDGQINIAVGMSANTKIWKNKKYLWSDLVDKLKKEHKTNETYKEFISADKADQHKIKDVGGYVGGYLLNGRRKPANVINRQLMTLDIDFAHKYIWDDYMMMFDNAAVLHATHKHCDTSPRYRLIMPLSRECTPDEYVAVSRQIAGVIGIDYFDNTTFETSRLMFWPSNPKDVPYYVQYQDGPWLDVDNILSNYADWRDSSLWPTADKNFQDVKNAAHKQEDPETKKGIVGAFCRTYNIDAAIEKYLSDVYVKTQTPDRYTYLKGTASAGLIIYDDKFAYSHHGTDPCSSKLCNSFDLVRIHLFGHLDSDKQIGTPKSFTAMEQMIIKDVEVKKVIALESIHDAKYEFADAQEVIEEDSIEWMKDLDLDRAKNYVPSAANISKIFANDNRLKGLFRQNDFDTKRYAFGSLPWRKIAKPEPIRNVDYAGVRNYIESIYGISNALKIEDSMALEFEKNHYHPVLEYLKGLKWDGIKRIDKMLPKFFGTPDNLYTQEAVRKMMVGAVARVYKPGTKFDLVLTLVGDQGTGKSTFIKALGQSWFSDSFLTVKGKEAFEQIQGAWIIEMAELSGLRKAEAETVKHFISKQDDVFRPAYGRVSETYPRQCVFFGTTNNKNFLSDPSGNRRFMPVDIHDVKLVNNEPLKKFIASRDEINQAWAEAVELYKAGESLYLSHEAEGIAYGEQKQHIEADERVGIIEDYLNKTLPDNWKDLDIYERLAFLNDPQNAALGKQYRDHVCIAEIWCECLGKNKEDMDKYKTRDINDIMRSLDGWQQVNSTRNFKIYGKQKFYIRKLD